MRYIVTELEGFATVKVSPSPRPPGISCHIIDKFVNHRLMATYRTEDYENRGITRARRRVLVREAARAHAERLNAALD